MSHEQRNLTRAYENHDPKKKRPNPILSYPILSYPRRENSGSEHWRFGAVTKSQASNRGVLSLF